MTKVSDLVAVTTVEDTDVYMTARAGESKKITGANLKAGAGGGGAMSELYDNIASGTIASWDVSSISQAYDHLMLVVFGRTDAGVADQEARIRFNNDSTAIYDSQRGLHYSTSLGGSEELAATGARIGWFPGTSATADLAASLDLVIPHYTGTVFKKAYQGQNIAPQGQSTNTVQLNGIGGVWRSTAAINRITIYPNAGNWITGSRLTIYGISSGAGGGAGSSPDDESLILHVQQFA